MPINKPPLPGNGVVIKKSSGSGQNSDLDNREFRSYEIYQRERPGESTPKITPGQLTAPAQLTNPYPALTTLRENYPCYRDWSGNAYWLTRYNDVTSVFADRANFSVHTRAHNCGLQQAQDVSTSIPAHRLWARLLDEELPGICERLLSSYITSTNQGAEFDLSLDYALALCSELQRKALGLSREHQSTFDTLMWHVQRADSWQPLAAARGKQACEELVALLQAQPATKTADNAEASLATEMPELTSADLLATVLGFEARTLHGWIANLAYVWLTDDNVRRHIVKGRANLKIAALETARYYPTVSYAHCWAKHEVERFGILLPQGALMRLSADAANRDPRVFKEPEEFKVGRRDICHREARGQFRADGLACGLTLGLGLPSRHPAVPQDRPRSLYALTRDAAVKATELVLERYPNLSSNTQKGSLQPPQALAAFEPMIAWALPVRT